MNVITNVSYVIEKVLLSSPGCNLQFIATKLVLN